MADSKSKSNRHKKRVVQKGLRALKNKPGWDVEAFNSASPEEKLRDFDQQMRGNQIYDQSGTCEACQNLRDETDDESALCDDHLAAAMGF